MEADDDMKTLFTVISVKMIVLIKQANCISNGPHMYILKAHNTKIEVGGINGWLTSDFHCH